jgi:hypothetical protein
MLTVHSCLQPVDVGSLEEETSDGMQHLGHDASVPEIDIQMISDHTQILSYVSVLDVPDELIFSSQEDTPGNVLLCQEPLVPLSDTVFCLIRIAPGIRT